MNLFLSKEESIKTIAAILEKEQAYSYDKEKHKIILYDGQNNEIVHFRLPISIQSPQNTLAPCHYIILLIQSGSSSIGMFKNGENINHKVIKSYMVRMKQGMSQIKYLKTKGKSRAGSRVRLSETNEFFENINERLKDQFKQYPIDRIAFSCSKILLPYLFNSKIKCPFDKKDERVFKIPRHIDTPDYEELIKTNNFLLKGELIYDAQYQELINSFTGK